MTDDASPENLRKFLESDDPALVRMGISLAKGAGVEVTVKDLERFLKSDDIETIKTGVMLANEAGIGDEVEMLCEALGVSGSPTVVAVALGEIGDGRAVEPLIKALEGDDWWDGHYKFAYALGEIGDARAVDSLIGYLEPGEMSEVEVAETAAEALGKIGDTRAVEPLIVLLGAEDVFDGTDDSYEYDFRTYAAEALGKIGDTRAVEPLIKALEDEHFSVRRAAKEALRKLGHEVE